jgi:hyaluronoglucosaminidase
MEKKLLFCLASFALLFFSLASAACANEKNLCGGIVEGFYGTPWQQEERLAMLEFMGAKGLNLYIYAPKDDAYHREKWREMYPADKQADLAALIKKSAECKVEFVFALSPGIDIQLGEADRDAEIAVLVDKFSSVYELGARRFAIFFDDIENKDGRGQALVINEVNSRLKQKFGDIQPLITVPTEYFIGDMIEQGGAAKPYTAAFAATLAKEIIVLYTGEGVVCEGITKDDMAKVNAIYGRKLAVWWNYPVNDYKTDKLALGPIFGIGGDCGGEMSAFIMNPMEKMNLSKIALQTGAAYVKSPKNYDAEREWSKAITEQFGALNREMKIFADHSQRMENSWAHTGRKDAPRVKEKLAHLYASWEKNDAANIKRDTAVLDAEFEKIEQAAEKLQQALPKNILAECNDQLCKLKGLAKTGRTGLKLLNAYADKDEAAERTLYREFINENGELKQSAAIISDEVLAEFIAKIEDNFARKL